MNNTPPFAGSRIVAQLSQLAEKQPYKPLSPGRAFLRVLILVLLTVFAGHALTMMAFRMFHFGAWEPVIEGAFMVAFLYPVSYWYFFRPLVRQVEACAQRQQAIHELARMLDLAHDGIVVRDLEGRIIFWNQGAERLYQWSKAEAVGRNVQDFLYKDKAVFQAANEWVLQEGEWRGELQLLAKNGGELFVNSHLTLIRDDFGAPQSVLAIIWDRTEQKKLEAQFLRAQRLESIGMLAGGIAHDLNNILAPIMMSAQLLRMNRGDAQAVEMLGTIETSVRRGAELVKQVLTFTRGTEGRRSVLQLKHLAKEVAKIAQETFPKDIDVRAQFPADLWPVAADATQIHQVLMNLAVNARDAMPVGGVLTLSAKNFTVEKAGCPDRPEIQPGPYVELEVADTGTGIPPEIRDKIFEPFFTTKDLGRGTGLGLSTTLGIVKNHGGWIVLRTESGRGTAFKVYLPASLDRGVEPTKASQPLEVPGQGELILIVDDEASICEMTKCILSINGYRTLTALNGDEALAVFSRQFDAISVVVTDLLMPGLNGAELIHKFRRIKPSINIIAATGSAEKSRELAALPTVQILSKPFTTAQLLGEDSWRAAGQTGHGNRAVRRRNLRACLRIRYAGGMGLWPVRIWGEDGEKKFKHCVALVGPTRSRDALLLRTGRRPVPPARTILRPALTKFF